LERLKGWLATGSAVVKNSVTLQSNVGSPKDADRLEIHHCYSTAMENDEMTNHRCKQSHNQCLD